MDLQIQNQTSVALLVTMHLLLNEAKGSNCVFSPISIHIVLGLVSSGSKSSTLSQLLSFLKSNSSQSLASFVSQLAGSVLSDGSGSGGPKLSSATSLWLLNSRFLKPSFKHVAEKSYKASTALADFINKPEEALSEVNAWVANETKGLIKEILPAGSVNDMTRLVIANALYFKGVWSSKFDVADSKYGDFHLVDGSLLRVPFMTSNKKQYVSSHVGFKVLRLPYNQGNDDSQFSMYLILPDAIDGLPSFIQSLSDAHFLLQNLPQQQVEVGDFRIPRFKISYDFEASEMLKEMGVTAPFSSEADLSEMVDSAIDEKLFVSKIFHKGVIEVNEEGTEAAAASGVVVQARSFIISKKIDFVADHPFLFMVREDKTGLILFFGQLLHPPQSV